MPRDPLSRVRPRRVSDCEPSAISENVGNRYVRATCIWSKAFSLSSCAIRIARLLASAALMASSRVNALVVEGAALGICAETGAADRAARRNEANKKINAPVGKLSREFTLIIFFCCPTLPRETANTRVIFQVISPRMRAIYDNLYCLKRRFCLPIVQNTRELALSIFRSRVRASFNRCDSKPQADY